MKYVIGNWKANKNFQEVSSWIESFQKKDLNSIRQDATFIVCPPYPFVPFLYEAFKDIENVSVGAQDVSFYGAGAYTGEVPTHSLDSMISHVIIGHSERRKYFKETDATVDQKADNAKTADIEPIICVRDQKDQIPNGVKFIAYEPQEAIGTGDNEDIEKVVKMKRMLNIQKNQLFIYGGSVAPDNASTYLLHDDIDGVLPGGASLDPDAFYNIGLSCIKA